MHITEFSAWLNTLLDPRAYKDYCNNGLCVEASDKVSRVVTGVSFRDRLIDAAIEEKADCIIVHHPNGFWENESRLLVGKFGERMRRLMKHGISLYGFHLPLDGQPEIGNNALIAKAMGLNIIDGFMREGEKSIGWIGEWETPASVTEFMECADTTFHYGVQKKFLYGKDKIKRVAICSGSGASGVEKAIALGCDAYITGDIKESSVITVEESCFNLLACGHYRTEIFGVRALAEKIVADLQIPAVFVDIDNPI